MEEKPLQLDDEKLAEFKDEEGNIDYEKLNQSLNNQANDIVKINLAKLEKEKDKGTDKSKVTEPEPNKDDDKTGAYTIPADVQAKLDRIDEIDNVLKTKEAEQAITSFETTAKAKGVSDEQIKILTSSVPADKLAELDLTAFARPDIKNFGNNKSNENNLDAVQKKALMADFLS